MAHRVGSLCGETEMPVHFYENGERPQRRKSFIEFLSLVRGANPRCPNSDRRYCQKSLEKNYGAGYVEKAVMAEVPGLAGGYLLPQDYSDALLETVAENSFILPRARVIPMFSADMTAPRIDVETIPTTAGVSALFGGVQFKWGVENTPTETEPKFRMTDFHAWDLLGYCAVSNQWLQDAGAVQPTAQSPRPEADPLLKAENYLIRLFGRAAAWQAEYAFLQGLGAAQQMPLGIINSPAARGVARAGAGAIVVADIANMSARLLPHSWETAVWACHPLCLAQINQIGSYFINSYFGALERIKPRPCGFLSNAPLYVTDKLPPLGSKGDLVLFDPALYIVVMRQEVLVDVSPDDAFNTNQTTYRVWLRLDGKPEFSNTITLPDTTTVVSPYVVLTP